MLGIILVSSSLATSDDFAFSCDEDNLNEYKSNEDDLDEGFLCETNAIHQLFANVNASNIKQHGLLWYYDIRGSSDQKDKGDRYRSLIKFLTVYINDTYHYPIMKEFHRCVKNGYKSMKTP